MNDANFSTAFPTRRLRYSVSTYSFVEAVLAALDIESFDEIPLRYAAPLGASGDQDLPVHQVFYSQFDKLRELYEHFVRQEIMKGETEGLCYQRIPTFRVQNVGARAVRRFHTDLEYNHRPGTLNYWLPLTTCWDTNTIWLETSENSGDFRPQALDVGEYLQFDAIRLRHGNQSNTTGKIRVSLDFRTIPTDCIEEAPRNTVTHGIPLGVGNYYSTFGLIDQDPDR